MYGGGVIVFGVILLIVGLMRMDRARKAATEQRRSLERSDSRTDRNITIAGVMVIVVGVLLLLARLVG